MMRPRALVRLPCHYGWVVVFAGMLTIFACLGLGRFALGMLLPSMGDDLAFSYAQMGYISTGNFVGYLLAVLASGRVGGWLGARRTIALGLLLVTLSMGLVSVSQGVVTVLLFYLITGIGTGLANIAVMGLLGHWFAPKRRGRAAGLMVVGSGLGIVFSGYLVPLLNSGWAEQGWRLGWQLFALATLITTVLAVLLIRNRPADLGLQPCGTTLVSSPATRVAGPNEQPAPLLQLASIYFLFGFCYVIFVTFIVTSLVAEHGFSESVAGRFWIAIGLLSLFSGPLFGSLSDRFGRRLGMALVFGLHGVAYLLAASGLGREVLFLSMGLFGIAAFSIPAIIAATVSDLMAPERAARVFGYLTFCFGIGQIIGPMVAGLVADYSGSFAASYLLTAAMMLLALILAWRLPRVS